MKTGSEAHDELLWRLAMQLSAQLPIEEQDRSAVLNYMSILSSRKAREDAIAACKQAGLPEDRRKELKAV